MSDYRGGRIVRIRMKDFMTYDDMVLRPKPGLNLVIGLNGSGKSSIMCAICLGLAGKPQYTGKSSQLSDFIKHGKDKATIEIELESARNRNVAISRVIQNEKSTWLLDGSVVPQNEVVELVKQFNIDVGNLCQFLPQEKVVEFSKMNKKERLENMFQAIGEPHLSTLFEELKRMKGNCSGLEKEIRGLQNNKESELQKNERLKTDVQKHEDRKKNEEDLIKLKMQRKMTVYHRDRDRISVMKANIKTLQKERSKMNTELQHLKNENDGISTNYKDRLKEVKELSKKITELNTNLSEHFNQMKTFHGQVDCAKIFYKNRMDEKKNQKLKLEDLEIQINGLRDSVERNKVVQHEIEVNNTEILNQYEMNKVEFSTLDSEMERIKLETNRLQYVITGLTSKIDKSKNEENKKLEHLRRKSEHVYQAVCWVKEFKHSFRKTICLPALLSMKVKNDDNRKYIETTVSERDLLAFVCEDENDVELLTKVLRNEKQLPINIILAPRSKMSDYPSPPLTAELRKIGVECYLKDLFDAPEPVIRTLCKVNGIHLVPICHERALQNMDRMLNHYTRFFTANESVSARRSKYGDKNVSVRRDVIRARNVLPSSRDDANELHTFENDRQKSQNEVAELNARYIELDCKRTKLEKEQEALRHTKHELLTKEKNIQYAVLQLRQKMDQYEKKTTELIDEAALKVELAQSIRNINRHRLNVLSQISAVLKDFYLLKIAKVRKIFNAHILHKQLRSSKEVVDQKESEFRIFSETLQQKETEKTILKDKTMDLYESIKTEVDLKNNLDLIKFMNPDLEEIERDIARIEAMLALDCEDNSDIVKEYNTRERVILDTVDRIQNYEQRLQRLKADIEEKKEQWLPPLETHIANINQKFSRYYKELQFAGEISLYMSEEDPDDFSSYGLMLKLQYRNDGPFEELSQHHSGGERSVAAIIFILSLQELTKVPFRCIDEINQGMDPVNERKIYDLIATAAQNDSSTQYFLLTPKLLRDLEYHRDVAVHIIFNAVFLDSKLDLKKHLAIEANN